MMARHQPHQASQLFTIRLWAEALGEDHQEIRGKVQHVASGEARHFRDWTTLEAFLLKTLTAPAKRPVQTNERREGNDGDPARSYSNRKETGPE